MSLVARRVNLLLLVVAYHRTGVTYRDPSFEHIPSSCLHTTNCCDTSKTRICQNLAHLSQGLFYQLVSSGKHHCENTCGSCRYIRANKRSQIYTNGLQKIDASAAMVHFKDLFRRSKRRNAERQEQVTSPASSLNVAAMPVAGMQRTNQGTYTTTFTSTTLSGGTSRSSCSDTSTTIDSSKTAVETNPVPSYGQSVWKGTPIGTTYDNREELTPEDEDMWANMAM